jgi:4-diphosphocytidyl-2-C-methyl-D-erythritol kinase
MTVYPNVKLNLGLRVLGKRPDGFHELETLFIPCDAFRDELEIEPSAEFGIRVGGPAYRGWDPAGDLTARAWELLHAEYGIPPVKIRLVKNSPVGAGLGGGSADGAFALRALSDMFSLDLLDSDLASLAARLGSDCPFFIYDRPMFATGRGEVLEPFDIDLSGFRIEVAVPEGVAVSTREAYAGLDAELPVQGEGASSERRATLREVLGRPVSEWRELLTNDFERSVFPLHPEIARLKNDFYAKGATYAAMSGSGSAVFALFPLNS